MPKLPMKASHNFDSQASQEAESVPPPPRLALILDGVTKTFPTRTPGGKSSQVVAFENVSLSIRQASFTTIVGPSGCGKTTLLSCIGGLVPYDSGTIRLMGQDVDGPAEHCATVFQQASLLPWWTIRRNVEYGLMLGRSVDRRQWPDRVERALALVELDLKEIGGRYPHQLSGGMQQRVNIARALAIDPQVLLMDEPFGALDAFTREVLQDQIRNISLQTGCTIVFITHDIEEALLLGDSVVTMGANPGRILHTEALPWPQPRSREVIAGKDFQEIATRIRNALRYTVS